MTGQRKDDGITFMKAVVAICLPFIALIGALVAFIYNTNASQTSENVSQIRKSVTTLVDHRIQANKTLYSYMANTDAQISRLSDKLDQTNKNLNDFCKATKQYEGWTEHECDYK